MTLQSLLQTGARIDFVDPQGTGGGGHFPNNHPFDNGTGGPDDDFAVRATGLLNIPEDGIYLFGFKSDDGSSLEIDGQAFSNIIFAVNGNSVINGGVLQHDINTSDSHTRAVIPLSAGQYIITGQFWERGGGAHYELYGDHVANVIPRLLEAPAGGTIFEPDVAGLQVLVWWGSHARC